MLQNTHSINHKKEPIEMPTFVNYMLQGGNLVSSMFGYVCRKVMETGPFSASSE